MRVHSIRLQDDWSEFIADLEGKILVWDDTCSDMDALNGLSAEEVVQLAEKLSKDKALKAAEINAVGSLVTLPLTATTKLLKLKYMLQFARTI